MDRILLKVLEYATENWQVLESAPLPFLLVLFGGFVCAFLAARWRYGGIIDHKKGEIDNLTSQVKLLQAEKDVLSKTSAQKPNSSPNDISVDLFLKVIDHIRPTGLEPQPGNNNALTRIDQQDRPSQSITGNSEPRPISSSIPPPVSSNDEAIVLAALATNQDGFTSVTELRRVLKNLPQYKLLEILPRLEQRKVIERDINSAVLRYRVIKL